MTDRHVRHRIERTKNKHSRAVFSGDTIVIRLAKNLSKNEEVDHIEHLLNKMHSMIGKEKQKAIIHPFAPLLEGESHATITLARGKKYAFSLEPGAKTNAKKTARGWKIIIGPKTKKKSLHTLLWKCLSESEKPYVEKCIAVINAKTYRTPVKSVRLKIAGTQWGSCSIQGNIMINAALLFAPTSLLEYVIVHELAHRKHHDHSPAYWKHVESALPSYKKKRERLQEYRLPNL